MQDGFVVLDAAVPRDRQEWVEVWQGSPQSEPAAHPVYAELLAEPGSAPHAAVYRHGTGVVLFPFLLRELTDYEWGLPGTRDAVSPYGYGGPFTWGVADGGHLADAFWNHFDGWLRRQRVVSLVGRLAVLDELQFPWPGRITTMNENVVRTLDAGPDEIWRDYQHKVRKNVRAATRHGLTFEVDLEVRQLEAFIEVYYATMDRVGSAPFFYFSREWFERLTTELASCCRLAHVRSQGRIVATELVLASSRYLYSFLGGTSAEAFSLRANDLLKHGIIEWGREQGKAAFVLGGGARSGDGISAYKRSFAPDGVVPFRVAYHVVDREAEASLVERRARWEHEQGSEWQPRARYVPRYRA